MLHALRRLVSPIERIMGLGLSGDSTKFLSGAGTEVGGVGALTLLEEKTASASATLDFTDFVDSTRYDEYYIEILGLVPATGGANPPILRMSTDGGATYDAGANYAYDQLVWRAGGSALGGGTGQTSIAFWYSSAAGSASRPFSGHLRLFNPQSTAQHKYIVGQVRGWDGTFLAETQVSGAYESTTAVNALRFLFSSGNITSGTIRIYGISKVSVVGISGAVVQVKNTQTGATTTGNVAIPIDDTIPQNTEGTEFLAADPFTPTNANNKLRIDVSLMLSSASAGKWLAAALFQDAIAGALAVGVQYSESIATAAHQLTFTHYMTAGTTSAITFKVRVGSHDTTVVTLNGGAGLGRLFGGVAASSITITEIVP